MLISTILKSLIFSNHFLYVKKLAAYISHWLHYFRIEKGHHFHVVTNHVAVETCTNFSFLLISHSLHFLLHHSQKGTQKQRQFRASNSWKAVGSHAQVRSESVSRSLWSRPRGISRAARRSSTGCLVSPLPIPNLQYCVVGKYMHGYFICSSLYEWFSEFDFNSLSILLLVILQ